MTRTEMLEKFFDGWADDEIKELIEADLSIDDFADAWDELEEIYESAPCTIYERTIFQLQ
jgi:hypothetical protein